MESPGYDSQPPYSIKDKILVYDVCEVDILPQTPCLSILQPHSWGETGGKVRVWVGQGSEMPGTHTA